MRPLHNGGTTEYQPTDIWYSLQEDSLDQMKTTSTLDPAPAAPNPISDRIRGAAFHAFVEKGYAGTSTLEIATRAKISKRDLYANYPNKQAILIACIASRAARMQLPPDLPTARNRNMLASILTRFGATVVREVCQPEVTAMFRLAICEAERSPDVAVTLSASRSANRDALAGLLAKAQAAGILGEGDSQQMMERFFALLWGDLLLGRLLGVTAPPEPAEIDRKADQATEAFLKLYANPTTDRR
jgi:AcrR family transcriptional regulator